MMAASRAPGRPAVAGLVAAGVLLALPAGLVELVVASAGLTELLPGLAPPLDWPGRVWLAAVIGVIAAAVALALETPLSRRRRGRRFMGWPKSLGLQSLARMARGIDIAAPVMPRAAPRPSLSDQAAMLERRRADQHPDAPPRPPLVASRDLPPLTLVPDMELPPVAPIPVPFATPIRDTTAQSRPRPLPRAPEPLSAAEVSAIQPPSPDALMIRTAPAPSAPLVIPAAIDAPPLGDVPLGALIERFEQQVDRRIMMVESASAVSCIDAAEPPAAVAPVVEPPQPDVDTALRTALDTLKRLSEQGSKAR